MKMVTLTLVDAPENFAEANFLKDDYLKAKKKGDLVVSYGTAMENIKNSRGMYRIKPEPKAEVEVKLAELKDPSDMTKEELAQEMAQWGKPLKTGKPVTRSAVEKAIRLAREKAADLITDDE